VGDDHTYNFTADKTWNIYDLTIEIKTQYKLDGKLKLWHKDIELRNEFEDCSPLLQPNDTLRITLNTKGTLITGAIAGGAKISGQKVRTTGGRIGPTRIDKHCNVQLGYTVGGSAKGTQGDEALLDKVIGPSAEGVNGEIKAKRTYGGIIELDQPQIEEGDGGNINQQYGG